MSLRLATWNVNSIRQRLEHLARLAAEQRPDVLCLQETKVRDEEFPGDFLTELGYRHQLICGQKSYNGVAIASRLPFAESGQKIWCKKDDKRHAYVRLPGDIELHNFYVPSGGATPDPEQNDKFAHKLQFLDEMRRWGKREKLKDRKVVLVGDFNVAPLETDVWNHKKLLRSVGHTPLESEKIAQLHKATGLIDVARHFVPPDQPLYSWWGYRFPQSFQQNYGWRLDHIWASPALIATMQDFAVIKDTRTWEKPSDHVPVQVTVG